MTMSEATASHVVRVHNAVEAVGRMVSEVDMKVQGVASSRC